MQTKEETTRILYVAPRYHTNQVPVMKGWYEHGVKVMFMAGYQGEIESHEYVEYYQMKVSIVSKIIYFFLDIFYKSVLIENKKLKWFVPDLFDALKQIKKFRPQLVILREYVLCNILISLICRMLGVKNMINYTQTPLHYPSSMNRLYLSLIRFFVPHVSFTPILYRGKERTCKPMNNIWHAPHHFIPLVCNNPEKKRDKYCSEDKIRLLDIGKYREYKNHFFIVDALSKVKYPEYFEITIIGQLSSKSEKDYHDRLEQYIKDKHLENIIHLRGHVDFNEMDKIYAKHDVLILASNEPANISVLESMSRGLCVIGSIDNGTSCYLDEYKCGITFPTHDITALVDVLNEISENRSKIKQLGQRAQKIAKEEFSFEKYKEGLNRVLQAEYNYTISI